MPRKSFDGVKLVTDVADLQAADKASPPTARPSLMDAVRAFSTFIETRTTLGWTDAMIAAVLTEAGYAIDAATLRSYRKRLRDEGRLASISPRGPAAIVVRSPATPTSSARPEHQGTANPGDAPPEALVTAKAAVPQPQTETGNARAPPSPASPPARRYAINQSKAPPDQA